MAIIHTIQIANEKNSGSTVSSTRKSESRHYLACLVATTTEASIRIAQEKKADLEKQLVAAQAVLTAECARWNTTAEAATANHEALSERWYNHEDGIFPTQDKYRKAYEAEKKVQWTAIRFEKEAREDLEARGIMYPYDKENSSYSVVEAASKVNGLQGSLERHTIPVLGSQAVLSWHGNVGLAQKALASREATYAQSRGDNVAIRTDITITETKKRAPKTVEAE
jgi:hypothetical protein